MAEMMKKLKIWGCTVYFLPVIHGLVEEGERVRKAIEDVMPSCIAIGISPEDIDALKNYDKEMQIPPHYEYYLAYLSNYGKVSLPPPDIKVAYEFSKENNIDLKAIDIDDDEYSDLLVKNVSIISLIRHSRKIKKLRKKSFKAENAHDFVFEWDKYMLSVKAFRKIERAREKKMAENLCNLSKNYDKILAIIPLERFDGVINSLSCVDNP